MLWFSEALLSHNPRWRPYYVKTTSFWRNDVKMTSFWRNNDVFITSCVQGDDTHPHNHAYNMEWLRPDCMHTRPRSACDPLASANQTEPLTTPHRSHLLSQQPQQPFLNSIATPVWSHNFNILRFKNLERFRLHLQMANFALCRV